MNVLYYNAYLPILVDAHPDVSGAANTEEKAEVRERLESRWSVQGFAAGYASGVVLAIVSIVVAFSVSSDSNLNFRGTQGSPARGFLK